MKIPKQAKKVFTGEIFDVYQWPQKMYDGSTATFEMLKRPNTVQIIPVINNKIIIAHEQQPTKKSFYTLLGGRQETNETPLAGAKRELKEESGLTSNQWKIYQKFSPLHKIDWDLYYFIAKNCQKKYRQELDAGEKIKLIEVNFEDFVDIVLSNNFWGQDFALYVAKLKASGKLNEFKKLLFK